jgi:hypothetical protein
MFKTDLQFTICTRRYVYNEEPSIWNVKHPFSFLKVSA